MNSEYLNPFKIMLKLKSVIFNVTLAIYGIHIIYRYNMSTRAVLVFAN